jgi:hypothetical protein
MQSRWTQEGLIVDFSHDEVSHIMAGEDTNAIIGGLAGGIATRKISKDTLVVPVYLVNGIDVNRIEGHGGNASYVAPLKTTVDNPFGVRIDASFGLPVRIQDQPVKVKMTP